MPYLALVGPGLRLLQKAVGYFAGKSDANPKTSTAAVVALAIEGFARYSGTDVETARAVAATVGKLLVSLGAAMGGS